MSQPHGASGILLAFLRGLYRACPASRRPLFHFSRMLPRLVADRAFLENDVFPYLNSKSAIRDILFAGVDLYTLHYASLLPGKQFQTIDIDDSKAIFADPAHHITGSVTELATCFRPETFDCVILNGLIGYGINDCIATAHALNSAFSVLRPGGLLIIGWNNTHVHLSFSLEALPEYRCYARHTPAWGALNAARIEANPDPDSRHTFDFLQKPQPDKPSKI